MSDRCTLAHHRHRQRPSMFGGTSSPLPGPGHHLPPQVSTYPFHAFNVINHSFLFVLLLQTSAQGTHMGGSQPPGPGSQQAPPIPPASQTGSPASGGQFYSGSPSARTPMYRRNPLSQPTPGSYTSPGSSPLVYGGQVRRFLCWLQSCCSLVGLVGRRMSIQRRS